MTAQHISFPDAVRFDVIEEGRDLSVRPPDPRAHASWTLGEAAEGSSLNWRASFAPSEAHVLAALDAAFTRNAALTGLQLNCPRSAVEALVQSGSVRLNADGALRVDRDALWQLPRLWHAAPRAAYPLQYTISNGRRHPLRPPKPNGVVYQRHIPWLGKTLTLRSIELERDLPVFNRWMNDPVVAHFWQEEGDLAKHRAYIETLAADPHATSLIGSFDDEPFGYFEAYYAKEDRIAPFYDVDDFDRGWHVLVGEAKFRGQPFLTAWMPSVSHYLFLDDCRCQRVVIEPRSDNAKILKSLARCGYAHVKEFDFPHKRAMLGMLLRERFFGEALWIPRSFTTDARP
ncbi:MAG: GNAT family N-acetyltransferase [Polyangiaceae bacterium]